MELIEIFILVSALLCSMVAGLVFTFAIVVMPGTKNLGDLAFLQSFKAMDRVIQNNHPLFMLVWLGSALVLLAAAVLGIWKLAGLDQVLLIIVCAIYLLGVQLPTVVINIPLNNHLQSLELKTLTAAQLREERAKFEPRWVRWNGIRTVNAIVTSILLLILLARL